MPWRLARPGGLQWLGRVCRTCSEGGGGRAAAFRDVSIRSKLYGKVIVVAAGGMVTILGLAVFWLLATYQVGGPV